MLRKVQNSYKERGIVLVISLIMLLMLTILAISSMQTTILEEKMAGNYRDRNTAFQAAEAALRAGEKYLVNTTPLPTFTGTTTGLYEPSTTTFPVWANIDWTDNTKVISYTNQLGTPEQPKYIIEELPSFTEQGDSNVLGNAVESQYYRVTSHATGVTETAVVELQSTYKR